jgi:cell division protein FtsW (lipid II flippase)
MRVRFTSALASAVTITFGLLTLFGLLLRDSLSLPDDAVSGLRDGADVVIQLATITIALAVLIGIINLISVHVLRIVRRERGLIYSLVLLVSLALTIGAYILDRDSGIILLETVLLSVESALAGVLFFALVYGAYRMMRDRVTWTHLLFVTVLVIVLLGALPLGGLDVIQDINDWLLEVPVEAGARGLLLGIALATVVAGVRILIGVDRSYRE